MPSLLQQWRQRAPVILFSVVSLALFAATLLTSTDDYSQYAVKARQLDVSGDLHLQPPTTFARDLSGSPRLHHDDDVPAKRLRVGLSGAGTGKGKQVVNLAAHTGEEDLSFTVQRRDEPPFPASPSPLRDGPSSSQRPLASWAYVRDKLDQAATSLGDLILGVFGFDEEDWFGIGDFEGDPSETGIEGGSLASWSESSVYVERTNSIHPSRPSSFGPHLLTDPLRGKLYPVESVLQTDAFGCKTRPVDHLPAAPSTPWIALVQRGQCPFSTKVRFAQEHGAMAVVFGDESEEEGGISGGHGLLTPWSPEDSTDITIPSTFVSRASYLSLLRTWQDEQELARHDSPMHDGATQTDITGRDREQRELYGLEVVLSKDEVFAWPLLDLLFMLLFLPSLLTLVTVFIQRLRMARASKAERAPKDAVARLPVFRWGEIEKPETPAGPSTSASPAPMRDLSQDEEREVGIAHIPVTSVAEPEEPTEDTALLHVEGGERGRGPPLVQRITSRLPVSFTRHLPSRLRPTPPSPPHRAAPRPTRRYPSLTECPFCLSDFEAGDLVMELPCSHIFHSEEIETWLQQQKGICPICRMSVLAPPVDEAAASGGVTAAAVGAIPSTSTSSGVTTSSDSVQPVGAYSMDATAGGSSDSVDAPAASSGSTRL